MKINTLSLPDAPDAVEQVTEEYPEGVEIKEIMTGLKTWNNTINGFQVFRLHYTADPRKRGEEWRLNERKKYGASEWLRESELVWEALEGRAVYADFWQAEFHVSKVPLGWNPRFPILRGWDFGLNAAVVYAQLFPHSRLLVLREAVSEDISFDAFLPEVSRLSLEWFPGARYIEFIDPTGTNRFGADGRSYRTMLADQQGPIRARRIISGENAPVERQKAVNYFLKGNVKGLPCYLVDPSCETLIKGFNGGYFFGFDSHGKLRGNPEKNFFSHVHDANQYLCSKCLTVNMTSQNEKIVIVEPGFGRAKTVSN